MLRTDRPEPYRGTCQLVTLALLASLPVASCASMDSAGDGEAMPPVNGYAGAPGAGATYSATGASTSGDPTIGYGGTVGTGGSYFAPAGAGGVDPEVPLVPPPPPEAEEETSFRVPVTTGHHIWATNPESGYVAVIDARTVTVQVVGAGYAPTYIAAVPSADREVAIVLNASSDDATLLPLDGSGVLDRRGVRTFPTHRGANSWAVSPSGRFAIAWTNVDEVDVADSSQGFQDITILSLAAETATQRSVGWRPISVAFDAAETRAFVVTEDGISAFDLRSFERSFIRLVEEGTELQTQPDVTITPDGAWAVVRVPVTPDMPLDVAATQGGRLRFVDLTHGGDPIPVVFGAGVYATDLDLSEDGTLAVGVVVDAQGGSGVVTLPIPEAITDRSTWGECPIPGQIFRLASLSPDGGTAVLYTRDVAGAADRVTILGTREPCEVAHRTVAVNAPVRAAFVTPDAAHAILTQDPPFGSLRAGAFSIVPLQAEIWPKLVGTDAPPRSVALSPDGGHGLVTVSSTVTGLHGVHVVAMPSLRDDFVQLASLPLATGILPEVAAGLDKAYVAQAHPEGRITIIDLPLSDPPARTITGFEINAQDGQ